MRYPSYRAPFIVFLAGTGISWFGNTLASIAIPWYVLTTTGSAAQTGVAASVTGLAVVIAALFGGVLIDRLGARRTVVLADLLSGLTLAAIPILEHFGRLSFPALLLLVFGGALLDPPGNAGRQACLPRLAGSAGLTPERANAHYTSVLQGTNLVGAAVAGLLIARFGVAAVLWLDAGTFVVAIGLTLISGPGTAPPVVARDVVDGAGGRGVLARFVADVSAGVRFLWRTPVLRTFVLVGALQSVLTPVLLVVILPVYIREHYGGAARLGLLLAAYTTGTLAGATLYGLVGHRLPPRGLVLILSMLAALALGALILPVPLGLTALALLLLGLEQGPIGAIANAQVQRRTPPALLGRVITATFAFALLGGPLGTLLGGIAVERAGLPIVLLLVLTGTLARWLILRRAHALHMLR